MRQGESKPSNESYRDFVVDSLRGLGNLRVRPMFGGYGFYRGNSFFGILWKGKLFFKTDDTTRGEYLALGAEPFDLPRPRRTKSIMHYYTVPDVVLDDSERLCAWAMRSAQVSQCAVCRKKPLR